MYERALRGKEEALGATHTSTLSAVNNLGLLYADQGKLAEAEKMYLRSLRGYEKMCGLEHRLTLDTAETLGKLYLKLGQTEEADLLHQRVLQGHEYALTPNLAQPSSSELIRDNARLDIFDSTDLISVLSLDVPPSLTSGSTLSDTSGMVQTAAKQFSEILMEDDIMQPLFPFVIQKAGPEWFQRNFLRLLKSYAVGLRDEASSSIQVDAARLIRSRANFIVHLIAESIQPQETRIPSHIKISESDRIADVERYLQGQVQGIQQYSEPTVSSIEPQSSLLSSAGYTEEDDEVDEPGRPYLINLDQVKKFMVESEAYKQLRSSFCHFILPSEEIIDAESQLIGMSKSVVTTPYRLYWSCVSYIMKRKMHSIANLSHRVVVIKITMTSRRLSLALLPNSLMC
jgi:hypothetical protein